MEIFSQLADLFFQFIEIVLHVDAHLFELVAEYGVWVYLFLVIIIFCETGLVVTPFLPGDSLLFACGALAGAGSLSYWTLWWLIVLAAISGDFVNYNIGHYLGPPVFEKDGRFLKRKHLLQAHAFYEKHGGKAIVLARFIPIVRTFAPFVAGVASMDRRQFLFFNIGGGLGWVTIFLTVGFFFGNLPVVRENFSLIALALIVIPALPVVVEVARAYLRGRGKGKAG